MADDPVEPEWPFPWNQFQRAGEQAAEQQAEWMNQFFPSGNNFPDSFSQLDMMSRSMATFKTRVQSGGRISIPDAEREALDIDEGDIVQTVVIPINRSSDQDE